MRKLLLLLPLLTFFSCGQHSGNKDERIITVSIAPFKYFVEAIAGNDFRVNVMVPPGADPHVYEPVPEQITRLRRSVGYISNGYLGFEMVWLPKFYEVNTTMKKLSLSDVIDPITSGHIEDGHVEAADPHYWMSPKSAMLMAQSIKDFIISLNSGDSATYNNNYRELISKIISLDQKAAELFSKDNRKEFMIYHPNLAYLARDYGLNELSVETDGKEPSPSGMKRLIDTARRDNIHTIFVQKEYDTRNSRAIASEIDAGLVIIDPLSADWYASLSEIIEEVHKSLN